jgi:hypothetical protein
MTRPPGGAGAGRVLYCAAACAPEPKWVALRVHKLVTLLKGCHVKETAGRGWRERVWEKPNSNQKVKKPLRMREKWTHGEQRKGLRADTEPLFTSAIHHIGERHTPLYRTLLLRPTTAKLVPRLCSHTKKCHDALWNPQQHTCWQKIMVWENDLWERKRGRAIICTLLASSNWV